MLQLTLGDKGAYLYGVFGTPFAHEDDGARACAAALEVSALEASTAARDIQIGITHGRLRSGTYGHVDRRTFVCLGDAVNLSARLMSKAPPGGIYVSELVRRLAGRGFTLDEARAPQAEGQGQPGRCLRADRHVGGPLAESHAVRPPDRRPKRRAHHPRRAPRRSGRRPWEHRRHLRRGRNGEVAAHRRVRSRRAAARRGCRFRRVSVLRDDDELRRLARGLEDAAPAAREPAGARADPGSRAGARGHRPGARRARPAPRRGPRHHDPGHRADELLRRQAAQDIAREPAGRLPARDHAHRAARARARGLPLARPALARPPRRDRAHRRARSHPARPRLPPGGGTAARARPRRASRDRGAEARGARGSRDDRGGPGEGRAARRRRHRGARAAPRPGREPRPGQPVLRRGAAELRGRAGGRPVATTARSARSSCPAACTASCSVASTRSPRLRDAR